MKEGSRLGAIEEQPQSPSCCGRSAYDAAGRTRPLLSACREHVGHLLCAVAGLLDWADWWWWGVSALLDSIVPLLNQILGQL